MKQQKTTNKINPYKYSWYDKIPYRIKAYIIKFWFAGAVYYFAGWGIYVEKFDELDKVVLIGLILGFVFEILVSNILRFMETDKDKADEYLLLRKKNFFNVFISVIYNLIVVFIIAHTYTLLNMLFNVIGVEPFGFGLLYLLYDFIFLFAFNLFRDKLFKKVRSV